MAHRTMERPFFDEFKLAELTQMYVSAGVIYLMQYWAMG
jgi:hypothetical protein